MTEVGWPALRPLLRELLGLDEGARTARLARIEAEDPALAASLKQKLEADALLGEFLTPPVETPSGEAAGGHSAGDRVGPYRLVERVGLGGMGQAWLAERVDGTFQRRVCVKLVKPGFDTEQVLARFRTERQVLAELDHPYIARLYGGGATEEGRPFLAMEYVDGLPIDRFCAEQGLGTEERVELVAKVAEAVAHAHGHGVVHRDLKPGNVLVTPQGEPRLLDFGIAKVLDGEHPAGDLSLTLTGQRVLTPRYAAPEQIRGEEVSPATDVYGLGLLLYELVAEASPRADSLTSLHELERAVLAEEPAPPSRALRRRGDTTQARRVAGDLDTLCLRALAADPGRRYASATAFAEDLRRFLAGLPVLARPDTVLYRGSLLVRRHRAVFGSLTAVIVVLLAALVVSLVLREQLDDAREAERRGGALARLGAAQEALLRDAVEQAAALLDEIPPDLRGWEWRHLRGRTDSTRLHVEGGIALAVAPDGRLALAMRRDTDGDRAALLDLETGEWHDSPLPVQVWGAEAAFSPDGSRLACSSHGDDLMLLAIDGDGGHRTLGASPDHAPVSSVAWQADGARVWTGHKDGRLRSWDRDGRALGAWQAHVPDPASTAEWPAEIQGLAVSPDGTTLATGSWDETVRTWTLDESGAPRPARTLRGHTRLVTCVEFAPDGAVLASGSIDGTVRLWDVATGVAGLVHRAHDGSVRDLAFLRGGAEILSGGVAPTLHRWDVRTGRTLGLLRGARQEVVSLDLDAEESVIAAISHEDLLVWGLPSDEVPTVPTCEYTQASWLSRDGTRVANASPDGKVRVWDVERPDRMLELVELDQPIAAVAWLEDDRSLLVAQGSTATLHDSRSGAELDRLELPFPIADLELAAGQGTFFVAGAAARVARVALETGTVLWDVRLGPEHLRSSQLELSTGGDRVAFVAGKAVRVMDLEGRLELQVAGTTAAWTSDGRLWVGNEDRLERWDVDAGVRELALIQHGGPAHSLFAHPDESRLFVGLRDGAIAVWDTRAGEEVLRLVGHSDVARDLELAADGSLLVSTGIEGTVRHWIAR